MRVFAMLLNMIVSRTFLILVGGRKLSYSGGAVGTCPSCYSCAISWRAEEILTGTITIVWKKKKKCSNRFFRRKMINFAKLPRAPSSIIVLSSICMRLCQALEESRTLFRSALPFLLEPVFWDLSCSPDLSSDIFPVTHFFTQPCFLGWPRCQRGCPFVWLLLLSCLYLSGNIIVLFYYSYNCFTKLLIIYLRIL